MRKNEEQREERAEKRFRRRYQRREAFYGFLDRLGGFFYRLFRPIRHFSRKTSQFVDEKVVYKAATRLDEMEVKAFERKSERQEARFEKKMESDEKRQQIEANVDGFFYRLFRPIRRLSFRLFIGNEKAIARRLARREQMESQLALEYPEVYYPNAGRLRFLLMFFLCLYLLGVPGQLGTLIETICGFVPPAFFILSGYLVLRESENRSQRIGRAIKRSALTFAVLAVVYFGMNLLFYRMQGVNIFPAFASKRFWFNFLVLNVWQFDIGSAIWYVQALLYAYIIIYFLDKWRLLRFDGIMAAVLLAFAIVTGELSGIIRWEILGYTYIPGNFLTRALPYILLGSFFHRNMPLFRLPRRIWYWLGIILGAMMTIAEILILGYFGVPGYYGHLIGMGVVAISVCLLAFTADDRAGVETTLGMSRRHINCIYYLCQPMSIGIALLLAAFGEKNAGILISFIGIFTFLLCFVIAWCISQINRRFFMKKENG